MKTESLTPEEKDDTAKKRLSELGFERDPFSDELGDPLFHSQGRQEFLDKMFYQVEFGPNLLIVSGRKGIGKTTLKNQFSEQADPDRFLLLELQSELLISNEQLLNQVASQCDGLGAISAATKEKELADYFAFLGSEGKKVVLMIDDAHLLDNENIELLIEVLELSENNLTILLFGQEILQATFNQTQFRNFFVDHGYCLFVPSLDDLETAKYIEHRLRLGGAQEEIIASYYSKEEKKQIFEISQGNPAMINLFGKQFLLKNMDEESVRLLPIPLLHAASVVVIAGVLLFILWYRGDSPDSEMDNLVVQEIPLQSVSKLPAPAAINEPGEPVKEVVLKPEVIKPEAPKVVNAPASKTEENKVQKVVSIQSAQKQSTGKSAVENVANTERNSNPRLLDDKGELILVESKPKPVEKTIVLASADKIEKPTAPAEQIKPVVEKPTVTEKPKSNTAVEKKVAVNSSPGGYHREDWLLKKDSGSYTLQLIGAGDEASVKRFLKGFAKQDQLAYFESSYKGKPWYVVVYGEFESKEAARNAIGKLPRHVQNGKPWLRSMKDIQSSIMKNRS